jgi:hypothetical protein
MRSHDRLMANPHFVPCPNGQHDPVIDIYSELLEFDDRIAAANGQTAMICPLCDSRMYWPRTFLNAPAPAPADLPVVYWSWARWHQFPPDKQREALDRIPNLTKFLR